MVMRLPTSGSKLHFQFLAMDMAATRGGALITGHAGATSLRWPHAAPQSVWQQRLAIVVEPFDL